MNFVPLIIDSSAEFALPKDHPSSVLCLPLGLGTVLGHTRKCLAKLQPRMLVVLASSPADAAVGEEQNRSSAVRFTDIEGLDAIIEELDASDYFLIVDTRSLPTTWPAAAELAEMAREYRGATHAVGVGDRRDRAIERIECERDGQVRRIRRLYATANWPEQADSSIVYSLVPVRSLAGVRFESLSDLRQELARRGVLSRDKPLVTEIINLAQVGGYLSLSERVVTRRASRSNAADQKHGIVLGQGCQVARTARLIPPVIVNDGARVEENVVIVGPALIGPEAHIDRDAVVAQSVVLGGAVVPSRTVVRHNVYAGAEAAGSVPKPGERVERRWHNGPEWSLHLGGVAPQPRQRGHRRISFTIKRLIDVLASGSALVILSPLMLLIALLVRLDSRGPILFGHVREGRKGREFRCLKFRTMVPDADNLQRELIAKNQVDGPQFKLVNDPRVTRVGHWLRATNLDELPQLINVLRGDMSLVGPRPSPFRENQICVAWRQARLSVRPGITGVWQICRAPDRSQGDFHEWIYYDMTYVRHFSLWLDVKILLATVFTLGGHRHVPLSWVVGSSNKDDGRSLPRAAA